MKKLFFPALVFVLAISLISKSPPSSNTTTRPETSSVYVLIENGGTVDEQDQPAALDAINHLMQQLSELERRRATRDTDIHIVLSTLPNRIAWSGKPEALLQDVEVIQQLTAFKPTFSDLVMSMSQISTTIDLNPTDETTLIWLGPTVHVPFQETSEDIQVQVPQDIPPELALPNFADRLTALKVYGVHPDQDEKLQDYFRNIGVLSRASTGELDFRLLGPAQTKGNLSNLL
ncbi:MAG: hypothetical protein NPIRA05_09650 [Nitrospirales bacterium]|nr:MAG: hypothetical protein NPIRA05_09650 [Nitrospirales bacterium]